MSSIAVYNRQLLICPTLPVGIFPLGAILEAATVPGATLDSTLNVKNTSTPFPLLSPSLLLLLLFFLPSSIPPLLVPTLAFLLIALFFFRMQCL